MSDHWRDTTTSDEKKPRRLELHSRELAERAYGRPPSEFFDDPHAGIRCPWCHESLGYESGDTSAMCDHCGARSDIETDYDTIVRVVGDTKYRPRTICSDIHETVDSGPTELYNACLDDEGELIEGRPGTPCAPSGGCVSVPSCEDSRAWAWCAGAILTPEPPWAHEERGTPASWREFWPSWVPYKVRDRVEWHFKKPREYLLSIERHGASDIGDEVLVASRVHGKLSRLVVGKYVPAGNGWVGSVVAENGDVEGAAGAVVLTSSREVKKPPIAKAHESYPWNADAFDALWSTIKFEHRSPDGVGTVRHYGPITFNWFRKCKT